ncbi:hypothetical protein KP77_09880 [Jeotgalibacillus alimentarius]|uniref:DUF5412 domain-containing protein n=2 Tax=Jeotgalibacillus TaxID=157226 RepID=A0A0C2W4E8_9BACL|nr:MULTISPECIES: DUF5412 domain-containing protein [Jeotgalibacillus]KIL51476.1 hypothetical protein KP77_09880 [Jeotgalibacillus alimentarius]MBM7578770.1 hypothetical protein [Jeotgalibacillus terrae]
MKKLTTFKKVMLGLLTGMLVLVGGFAFLIYWLFYDMDRLPQGEFITEETSPDGTYTVKAYRTNGGATTAYAVRGELVTNNSGKTKNIYWQYRKDAAEITWQDEDTVMINGIELDVPGERYDYRKEGDG